MDSKSFGKLPETANTASVQPYSIQIPKHDVAQMQQLVEISPIASACYENSLPNGDNSYGLGRDWLVAAKERWANSFDWNKTEARLNGYNHFIAKVADEQLGQTFDIHFVALFSQARQPVKPIILLHGWPGSFLEFLSMLDLLKDKYSPENLPYHIVVPSLPGYLFSSAPPLDRDFGLRDVARLMDSLMVDHLGFGESGYIAQGGDVGSRVCRVLAAKYDRCRGTLLNYNRIGKPEGSAGPEALSEEEKAGLERCKWFDSVGTAYAMAHATRPSTIGLVLSSSPIALLAWVGEKFVDWSDPKSYPPEEGTGYSTDLMDEVLLSASLYWLTGTPPRCLYSYRETYDVGSGKKKWHELPDYHIRAPKKFGFTWFPLDLAPIPKSWIETTGDLVWFHRHEVGGHFAAMEQPAALLGDVEEFCKLFG
ncbi:hypothetical protein MCOR27_003207 [Pyricularia oryzae]|uniref:Epoxide hydrolase N-terminal domain-containing protein n=2 Tax=Pyricularia TaxID=48558 RepID=A0ABQ8NFP5_PYRGI|nr:hypothetical protein MCOR01_004794 [Pyricularia oryzae]KAI6295372.1 hypothetical protein MCOR33_007715 [Pyricularia grisea]KAH9431536.1 hypothetical protein MCOR02_008826 [Pyricularia oryzae]KAI6256561.1 hypothetical protein MCOR19_007000 [Pyricularia oryzae]KAI6283465.1 hypothetical protein MCOR27_003207 [Pyricularia oryzae]